MEVVILDNQSINFRLMAIDHGCKDCILDLQLNG